VAEIGFGHGASVRVNAGGGAGPLWSRPAAWRRSVC